MKAKTQEQKNRSTSLRLLRTYGITLEEYNQRLFDQKGGCAVCHKTPGESRLHVDHDHKLRYTKILSAKKYDGLWFAAADTTRTCDGFVIAAEGKTKSEAIQAVRKMLKRASVRGILCWSCNSGLQKFRDSFSFLYSAAMYLERYLDV